jgi:hypothetical protein
MDDGARPAWADYGWRGPRAWVRLDHFSAPRRFCGSGRNGQTMRRWILFVLCVSSLGAATHEIYPNHHLRVFSAHEQPELPIYSGDTVITKTRDSGGQDQAGTMRAGRSFVSPIVSPSFDGTQINRPAARIFGSIYPQQGEQGDKLSSGGYCGFTASRSSRALISARRV